jgi:hypothetical protein
MRLTANELTAMASVMGDDGPQLCRRLSIPEPTPEALSPGMSSLYARELLVDSDDGLTLVNEVTAAVGLAATAELALRLTRAGDKEFGSSQLHAGEFGTVVISPLGMGCFDIAFLDQDVDVATMVDRAATAALETDNAAFVITNIDTGKSSVVRRSNGATSIHRPDEDDFTAVAGTLEWHVEIDMLAVV